MRVQGTNKKFFITQLGELAFRRASCFLSFLSPLLCFAVVVAALQLNVDKLAAIGGDKSLL